MAIETLTLYRFSLPLGAVHALDGIEPFERPCPAGDWDAAELSVLASATAEFTGKG